MSSVSPACFGSYQVLQRLSQGGMGDVVLARKTGAHGFEKLFAVKTLRRELAADERYRRQFNDEARLVSRLLHPNIGQVFDYGEQDGVLYLVMEYVDGVALSKLLTTHGRLAPKTAVEVALLVARALHHAHRAVGSDGRPMGVVHRDVSPQNIMLTSQGVPKLIDFGIALMRNRESPETVDGVKGKVGYMSPEQLLGRRLDARTDIFSLGVVLHEMLTGRSLFSADNVAVTVTAIMQNDVAPPSAIVPEVPRELDAVVMKALARKPEERYPDADAFAAALVGLPVLTGGSIEAFAASVVPALRSTPSEPVSRPRTETATRELEASDLSALPSGEQARPRRRAFGFAALALLVLVPAGAGLLYVGARQAAPSVVPTSGDGVTVAPTQPEAALVELRSPTAHTPAPESERATPPSQSTSPQEKKSRTSRRGRERPGTPAPAPSAPAVETALGAVSIVAEPYAQVRIDGGEAGVTPLLHQRIAVGRHVIEFVDPETGRVRESRVVLVEAGKESLVSVR